MNPNITHLGTISIPNYQGSVSIVAGNISPVERLEPQHAFESHFSYPNTCRWCDSAEAEHCFGRKIAEYLKALCSAHRTLSPVLERRAQYWWKSLSESEKILAYTILDLTGAEVWK